MVALIIFIALLTIVASAAPFVLTDGPGPSEYTSVRGDVVELYGYGPYRHMPADVAVQGMAQDLVTLVLAVPLLLTSLLLAWRGSKVGYILLSGSVAYLFVQYTMYLAMGMYNELFLIWTALVLLLFQTLVRLLLAGPSQIGSARHPAVGPRRFVASFLLVNGTLIALMWLSVLVPPLLDGTMYPEGLAHFTTMIVQGFDLALFVPPSLVAGYHYLKGQSPGEFLAPVYTVFLSLQMPALLAKIVWMSSIGASAGPALVIIPLLLVGALSAAYLALRPHRLPELLHA